MSTILLFPTDMEAQAVKRTCPHFDIRVCGVGAAQVARFMHSLLTDEHPDSVVLCGIAGAYNGTLKVGDVVAVNVERMAGVPMVFAETYRSTMSFSGLTEVTANTVASVGASANGAQIENMEGAVVFALCEAAGVKCGEIRAVSNLVSDVRDKWCIPQALDSLANVLTDIL